MSLLGKLDDDRFNMADVRRSNRFEFNTQSEHLQPPTRPYTQLGNESVDYVRTQESDR